MDMGVEGRHALLFDEDATAAFVNSPEALVPWNNDPSLLIDRYDVRHLLDRIPSRSTRRSQLEERGDGVSQSDLDLERFLDLPTHGGDFDSETLERSEPTGSGAYQAVPMIYDETNIMADAKYSDSGSDGSVFHPPFHVPESLLNNLPPTEKLHQIIARTAIFVSEHGGQSEIVLRVKQGDNPTFGFLMPDHHLHAYFRYLVDHPQLLKSQMDSNETQEKNLVNRENEADNAAGGALSLLGSVYGYGDDDDASAVQPDSKEMKSGEYNIAGNALIPERLEHKESSTSTASEDMETSKYSVAASVKERIFSSQRNHGVNTASYSVPSSKKAGDVNTSTRDTLDRPQSSQSDIKPLVLEPPSSLKGAIDKMVEFILRNGKEFEAILIEQDKVAGRFPFLLPTNQYHSYYLKILREAHESKLLGKNLSDQKNDSHSHVGTKKRRQEFLTTGYDGAHALNSAAVDDLQERKEKFKMIIGGTKKDDQRPPRQSRLSAEDVAAIVLAATRGSSPANPLADQQQRPSPTAPRQSGASPDEAAAIILAATRGSTPPLTYFKSTSLSKGETSTSFPVASSGSTGKPDNKDTSGADVLVAKAIAETVALEADSSEASLTKEQKLKAERLKRAKMFAAMVKSGSTGSLEVSNVVATVAAAASDVVDKERVVNSSIEAPLDTEVIISSKSREKDSIYDHHHNREHRSRRKSHRTRSRDHIEDDDDDSVEEEDYNPSSRKKHRTRDSPHHHSRDYHKHHSEHSTSKDKKELRHHRSPEHRRRRSSSRHGHRDDLSENEDAERKRSSSDRHHHHHRRKHGSHSVRHRRDTEMVDSKVKRSDHLDDVPSSSSNHLEEVQPSETTEVPNDLRAKIRAMLLETM